MDLKHPFGKVYTKEYNLPVITKVKMLNKYIDENINQSNFIRSIDLDYERKKNLYKYMKNLAFMKYQYINYIKILRKIINNTYNEVKLVITKRSKSHYQPIHDKLYHILIYKNLYNYRYKPYTLPLKKSDYTSNFCLTDENLVKNKKIKIKKRTFINPYYQREINDLKKKYDRIVERKNLAIKNSLLKNKNSNNNVPEKISKNNSCVFLGKKKIIGKKSANKSVKNIKPPNLILPKIKNEYLSAQENSDKIEKDIKMMNNEYCKVQMKENKSKNKKKEKIVAEKKPVKFSPLLILHAMLGEPPEKIKKKASNNI